MQLLDFIICEEIRGENDGKTMLLGMFQDDILMPAGARFPAIVRLATYVRFRVEEEDEIPDHFELQFFLAGEQLTNVSGPVRVANRSKPVAIGLTGGGLALPKAGVMTFAINFSRAGRPISSLVPSYELEIRVLPATTQAAEPPRSAAQIGSS